MSFSSIGLAIACSVHDSGATADIDIFYRLKSEHELMLKNMEDENDILDASALCDRYYDSLACLLDKEYQRLAESGRGIVPTKKEARTALDHGRRE